MESSEEPSSSSLARMDTSISDYDAVSEVELPFGEKVSVTGDGYLQNDSADPTGWIRGASLAGTLPHATPQTMAESNGEDVRMSDFTSDTGEDAENDLSPLEYARLNGLTFDYRASNPLQSACIPSRPTDMLIEFDDSENESRDDELKTFIHQCNNERWDLDKDTAKFLTWVMALGRMDNAEDNMNPLNMSDLKLDEPVLPSDPECEVARLRARNAVRISTKGVEPCRLDTQKDESLLWCSEDLKLPSEITETINNEKLDIDKETMKLLKDVMHPSVLDHWETVEQAIDADMVSVASSRVNNSLTKRRLAC